MINKMNRLVNLCMMVAAVVIVSGAYASSSYGQDTSTTDDAIAPANQLPPAAYVNAIKGFKIGGNNRPGPAWLRQPRRRRRGAHQQHHGVHQYGPRSWCTSIRYHRERQYGQRSLCPLRKYYRGGQHGQRFPSAHL
jgi:hypothetical protein